MYTELIELSEYLYKTYGDEEDKEDVENIKLLYSEFQNIHSNIKNNEFILMMNSHLVK